MYIINNEFLEGAIHSLQLETSTLWSNVSIEMNGCWSIISDSQKQKNETHFTSNWPTYEELRNYIKHMRFWLHFIYSHEATGYGSWKQGYSDFRCMATLYVIPHNYSPEQLKPSNSPENDKEKNDNSYNWNVLSLQKSKF